MPDTKAFVGSVPENYERYLVPLIFEEYAADLVSGETLPQNSAVLETACGTGVVTRRLRTSMPTSAGLIATDFAPPMIEQAKASLKDLDGIEFRQADATELPFEADRFDAVFCQFGVMFFPDKAKGYREAARVLKPGGAFVFNVWDSHAYNHFAGAMHKALSEIFAKDPPRFMNVPYHYHDIQEIRLALQDAGFGEVELTVQPRISQAPSARHAALAFCTGTPLAGLLAERDDPPSAEVIDLATEKFASQYGTGSISALMQSIQIVARMPGEA
jgi:ubiquinone/menaquinone biosynthesis C-methylase UbiE